MSSDLAFVGLFSLISLMVLTVAIRQNRERINAVNKRMLQTHDLVEKLEHSVNSRMDAYLEKVADEKAAAIESAHLTGTLEERTLSAARAAAVEVARSEVTTARATTGGEPTIVDAAVSVRMADDAKRLADETARLADETARVADATEGKNA